LPRLFDSSQARMTSSSPSGLEVHITGGFIGSLPGARLTSARGLAPRTVRAPARHTLPGSLIAEHLDVLDHVPQSGRRRGTPIMGMFRSCSPHAHLDLFADTHCLPVIRELFSAVQACHVGTAAAWYPWSADGRNWRRKPLVAAREESDQPTDHDTPSRRSIVAGVSGRRRQLFSPQPPS
jgi:hypothetical protein